MRFALVIILGLLSLGCRSDQRCQRQTALLRAEFLDMEDKYYRLKSRYESEVGELPSELTNEIVDQPYYSDDVIYDDTYYGDPIYDGGVIYEGGAIYEGEVIYDGEVLHDSPQSSSPTRMGTTNRSRRANSPNTQRSRGGQLPSPGFDNNGNLDNLENITPEPGSRDSLPDDSFDNDSLNNPANLQPQLTLDSPDQGIAYTPTAANRQVTEIVINRHASRGRDIDGMPGDEGIDLLVQPRTADGTTIYQAGELTVSVVDPQIGQQDRIGLWKFLPEETKLFFSNDEFDNRGILLHLPWDQATPVRSRLIVHVRFITDDGRILKTSSEIRVKPPAPEYSADDPLVASWTQRDPRWLDDAALANLDQSTFPYSGNGTQGNRNSAPDARFESDTRNQVPAIQAKARINRPSWRPVR